MKNIVRRLIIFVIKYSMKTEKHYFAGINSNDGFCNHFSEINKDTNGYTYILKGGPGTGKSTLMKKIGEHFSAQGESVEYYHCSSDPDSLDGVYIPNKNISVVDGTAPHVCEASIVMCSEQIVNLGEYISPSVAQHKRNIENLLPKKQREFTIAYDYLKSAGILYHILEETDIADTKNVLTEISTIIDMTPSTHYTEKNLFLSAVDRGGAISLEQKNEYRRFITLTLSNRANHQILQELHTLLKNNHVSHYTFGEILSPADINSIYVVDDNILIRSEPSCSTAESRTLTRTISGLLRLAGKRISTARKWHKQIERYYRRYIDFPALNQLTQQLISDIEKR